MSKYNPTSKSPISFAEVANWVHSELLAISRALASIENPIIVFTPQHIAPSRPSEGMVVNADGTDWDPGSGAGLYQYLSGSWVAL